MPRSRPPPTPAPRTVLRAEAEAQAARDPAAAQSTLPAAELAHELNVHRIELEMQNEELRRAQVALEAARDRYVDLYDFAPVGYLAVGADGLIAEVNLTGASLLGVERARLIGKPFVRHVEAPDRDRWHRHLLTLNSPEEPGRIELTLLGRDGRSFHAQLDSLRIQPPGAAPLLRMALTDITERKRTDLYRRLAATASAGREADRRRVALQLHEDLGQRLCALKMDLDRLHSAEDRPARHERMGAMLAELDLAVTMVRRISTELRPAMLDQLGLNAAIEWLVRDTSERLGVALALKQDDIEPPLEEDSAVAVYRLVQDVLSRLGDAPQRPGDAAISVRRQAPGLVVSLQARGLALSGPAGSAQDTTPLQERTHALGGQLKLDPDASGGACITVRVPIEPAEGGRHLRLAEALS